jgi:hypothetical protein
MDGWFSGAYHTDLFYNYIDKHNLYREFYTTPGDLGLIHRWMASALQDVHNVSYGFPDNPYPLKKETIARILSLRDTHPVGKAFDQNLLFLVMANRAFGKDDTLEGFKYYQDFDKNNFAASRDKYEYLEKTYFLNQLNELCINLALIGRQKEAVEMTEKFEKDNEKTMTYSLMAEKVYNKNNDPTAFAYLDSAFSKSKKVDISQLIYGQGVEFRFSLIRLLSRIGARRLDDLSAHILSEIIGNVKLVGIWSRADGIAGEGNFYRATTTLPSTMTEFGDVIARIYIIWHACLQKESVKEREKWAGFDRIIAGQMGDSYINYVGQ